MKTAYKFAGSLRFIKIINIEDHSHPLSVHSPEAEQELTSVVAHSAFSDADELYLEYSK